MVAITYNVSGLCVVALSRNLKWQGSGAKPKYSVQTKTVAFRCPLSKVDELKLIVKAKLSEWSVK